MTAEKAKDRKIHLKASFERQSVAYRRRSASFRATLLTKFQSYAGLNLNFNELSKCQPNGSIPIAERLP